MISYYPPVPISSNKMQVWYAKEFGISASARHFETTYITIREWVRRFDGTIG